MPREDVPPGPLPDVSENSAPEELVAWMVRRFAGHRTLMTTAFGMEGCALIDLLARHGRGFTVASIDTGFLFAETVELRARLMQRYPHLDFVTYHPALTPEEQAQQYGDELWKRAPDACCRLRKVLPMVETLAGMDVWITGLRRTQSMTRRNLRALEWDWRYEVLKFSPLASWERTDVWAYIQAHDVPCNPLHERGYPSVGCTHCTVAVPDADVTSYSRAGRWNGQEKTECGLHGDGI